MPGNAHPRAERRLELGARAKRLGDDLVERLPLEILHRDVKRAVALADLVRVDHVRVVQARRETRLVQEHVAEALFLRELRAKALDDDELVEPHRAAGNGEIHVRHAASAEAREDLISPETRWTIAWKGRDLFVVLSHPGHCPSS